MTALSPRARILKSAAGLWWTRLVSGILWVVVSLVILYGARVMVKGITDIVAAFRLKRVDEGLNHLPEALQ